jgi:hypothetical protein
MSNLPWQAFKWSWCACHLEQTNYIICMPRGGKSVLINRKAIKYLYSIQPNVMLVVLYSIWHLSSTFARWDVYSIQPDIMLVVLLSTTFSPTDKSYLQYIFKLYDVGYNADGIPTVIYFLHFISHFRYLFHSNSKNDVDLNEHERLFILHK